MLVSNKCYNITEYKVNMKNSPANSTSFREQKRMQVRMKIQQEALLLFLKQGYSNTTVAQIASAANVSHMSVFRYFPTKEAIVLDDNSEGLIAFFIDEQPNNTTITERIEVSVLKAINTIYPQEKNRMFTRMQLIMTTPELRAKMWDKQIDSAKVISKALRGSSKQAFKLYVLSAAYVAAITIAVEEWVRSEGKKDLPVIIKNAFQTLRENKK